MTTQDPAAKAAAEIAHGEKDRAERIAAIIRREHEPYLRLLERAVKLCRALESGDVPVSFPYWVLTKLSSIGADAAALGIGRDQE